MLENTIHPDCTHRLYLTFDDGTTNHFVLDSEVSDGSTILKWTILQEHIFKSGLITVQIKTFCDDESISHTPHFYLYAYDSAEYAEGFIKQNSEFLEYETKLNLLISELEKADLSSYVKSDRKVAGHSLSNDIQADELLDSLKTYPLKLFASTPTKETVGKVNQLGVYIVYNTVASTYTADLYVCRSVNSSDGSYNWVAINSGDISDDKIASQIAQYIKENPLEGTGADGKSAYQVALDNGFEGTEEEWLQSLKGVDGQNGKDGADGEDGISPRVTATPTNNGWQITCSDAEGVSFATIYNGKDGEKGDTGAQGEKGADGKDGQDGKTPVLGVDYFTEEDKTQIAQSVIDSLGATPVFGYVDENNNVIVRGLLSDGTYNIKYELEDGTTVEIGELTLSSDEPDTSVYTNQIPLSTEADGTLYNNGQGFKTGYRISGSSGNESAQDGTEVTGFIPVKYGDTVYLKGIVDDGTHIIALYNSNHEKIVSLTTSQIPVTLDGSVSSFTIPTAAITNASSNTDYAFIRLSATQITADSIITVNEPIK